jgi:uncharacterized protein YndB with AHSA1/START domain
MIDFNVSIQIDRPVPDVFAYVTDPAKLSSWQANTVSVAVEDAAAGPLAVGTRLRETHRAPGGRQVHSRVEVSELERDRRFALRILEGPLPVHGTFAFAPTGPGTRVELHAHGAPTGLMRLGEPLFGRVLRRPFGHDLARLKQVLEQPELAS